MRKTIIITLLKVVFVSLLAGIPVFLIKKKYTSKQSESYLISKLLPRLESDTPACYFLGSSRTAFAINDSLLNKQYPSLRFVNLGISGCNLLFNKIIADKLLQQPGSKTIFIELSAINARMPAYSALHFKTNEIFQSLSLLKPDLSFNDYKNIFCPIAETILFNEISLNKYLLPVYIPSKIEKSWRHQPSDAITAKISPYFYCDTSFSPAIKSHPLYNKIISGIIEEGRLQNSKLIFFISPAFSSSQEKTVLTTVFNNIAPANKLTYDPGFLKQLNNPVYFHDATHLNSNGAKLFSTYLSKHAKEKGWIK